METAKDIFAVIGILTTIFVILGIICGYIIWRWHDEPAKTNLTKSKR